MIKRCWVDAGLLTEETFSGEAEEYAVDRETEEEVMFIRELAQQCESLALDEGESLVSDDEVELIEIEEKETVEDPIENSKSTSVVKLKQRQISQFFSKSDS